MNFSGLQVNTMKLCGWCSIAIQYATHGVNTQRFVLLVIITNNKVLIAKAESSFKI